MRESFAESSKIAFLGWLATVGTSACFLPTITNKSYFFIGAFITAVLVLLGTGLRLARTPAMLVLAAQVVALVEMLLLGYGSSLKYGLLPTRATVTGLQATIESGLAVASKYAAPAPKSAGLTLLVLFAIGVVAILVDFLAAGVRRVPLTGLPLLTMYTIPVTALPEGVPFYGFLPGAAAFVALLLADERDRLSHWGRLVARTPHGGEKSAMDTSGLVATGRRISVIAVSAAVVMPIFIPAFSSAFLDNRAGSGSGPGEGPSSFSFDDPMVSLASSLRRPEPVDVLKVSSDEVPEYLRLVVLDSPGPNNWSAQPLDLGETIDTSNLLPRPTGMVDEIRSEDHQMSIEVLDAFPTNSSWLPVPFFSYQVAVDGDWGYVSRDQTVTALSETAAASLSEYAVSYSESIPTSEQLAAAGAAPADIRDEFGTVPGDVPPGIENLARAISSSARTPYEQAVALQNFFRDDRFTYDVDAAYGYGYEAMTKFLQERRGFCQQFAASMAMMARTLGIPSRIAVGFLKPARTESDGTYVITSHDVHSWPELYFEGAGWVRFEPTPGVGATLPTWAPRKPAATARPTGPPPNLPTGSELTESRREPPSPTAAAGATDSSGGDDASAPSKTWLWLIAVTVIAMAPMALRRGIRRSRLNRPIDDRDAAESAWLELRDHIRDLRLPWTGSMTPRARERSVTPLLTGDAEGLAALKRLCLSVERSRYAVYPLLGTNPAADVVTVMGSISEAAERSQRLRALLLPSSLGPDLREALASVTRKRRTGQTAAE